MPWVGVQLEELVLGPVDAAEVDLGPCDVGMDLHGACHDRLVLCIDNLCRGTDLVDNLSVLYRDIFFVALDALDRVKDMTVLYKVF